MLYQLSYASPIHLETNLDAQKSIPMKRADTLPLRTFNGTEIKVSTPPPPEQTMPWTQTLNRDRSTLGF